MSDFVVLRSPAEWRARFGSAAPRTTLSVGNFDGLHLGHQAILAKVVTRARITGTLAAVVTFDPHPLKVLRPDQAPPLVQTLPQRLAGMAAAGLDAALVLRFDAAFAALGAAEFVGEILVDVLRADAILVGKNFRFGCKQQGDVALLAQIGKQLGPQLGFSVELVPPVAVAASGAAAGSKEDIVVSSTAVRRAVLDGRVADAARLLGRSFALTGAIKTGSGRGSTILFPTLNLAPEQELLPKPGVYVTQVLAPPTIEIAGESGKSQLYGAATNVGFRPTFNGTHLSIESHLFDFSPGPAPARIELRFLERLRDERKFAGPGELRAQIASDLTRARDFLAAAPAPKIRPPLATP